MSRRGLLPVILAVGFGIANGYMIFNPAFQNLEVEKLKQQEQVVFVDRGPWAVMLTRLLSRAVKAADLGPNMVEISVKDPSWAGNAPATTADTGTVKETLTVEGSEKSGGSRPTSWWQSGV